MKYDVRIDGNTVETFDTFEGANAQADKLNGHYPSQRLTKRQL